MTFFVRQFVPSDILPRQIPMRLPMTVRCLLWDDDIRPFVNSPTAATYRIISSSSYVSSVTSVSHNRTITTEECCLVRHHLERMTNISSNSSCQNTTSVETIGPKMRQCTDLSEDSEVGSYHNEERYENTETKYIYGVWRWCRPADGADRLVVNELVFRPAHDRWNRI